MKNLIKTNTATNAMEAKVITDDFLNSISDYDAFRIMGASFTNNNINIVCFRLAYAIGAGSYYYGSECKIFPSDKIANVLLNKGYTYIKSQQAKTN